jgi:four helix bundle protein
VKSANETIYWLNLSKDSKICDSEAVIPLIDEARQLSLILGKSVLTLKT